MGEVLSRAYLLTQSYGLSKGWFRHDEFDTPVMFEPGDDRVCAYCVRGFISRAVEDLIPNDKTDELRSITREQAYRRVLEHLKTKFPVTFHMLSANGDPVAAWNDRPERKLRDVSLLFRETSVAAATA